MMPRLALPICLSLAIVAVNSRAADVDFNREVRPILAAKCFACHGPDESTREAHLRLDVRQDAIDAGALAPKNTEESELLSRIDSDDPDLRMPPPHAHDQLTAKQRRVLRDWIADGARYDQHWAFVPPQKADLPQIKRADWCRNEIDRFILARIEANNWQPADEAAKITLVRRLYLDLIGLPPTPAEADAFVNDDDSKAYANLVDRLLKSPQYGERWARLWLDLARYSDTNGYEKDRNRSIWPYRDWVIRALNDDMPFDQFTIEQIAGDMLPNATDSQRIATGFHRNTMLNEEGGIDPLEYRFYAMVDRVATTGTVWLGMTTGCAQCHSHKYDPISHTDYYSLMALLNNADEPDMTIRSAEQRAQEAELQQRITNLEQQLAQHFPPAEGDEPEEERRAKNLDDKFAAWIEQQAATATNWQIITPDAMKTNLPKLDLLADGSIFSTGDITKRDVFTLTFRELPTTPVTALKLEALPDERLPAGGPGRTFYEGRKGDFFLSELSAKLDDVNLTFKSGSHSYGKISIGSGSADAKNLFDGEGSTGWSTSGNEGKSASLVLNFAQPTKLDGDLVITMLFERHFATSLGRFRLSLTTDEGDVRSGIDFQLVSDGTSLMTSQREAALTSAQGKLEAYPTSSSAEIEAILAKPTDQWTEKERQHVLNAFLQTTPELAEARKEIDAIRKQLPDLPTSMVMQERPADNVRPTHRHHRGEFLSPRERVQPSVPKIFAALTKKQPTDRLELARWLVSGENPLVARVTVNRAWRAFFGHGIMRTSGDFGTQSDPPSHPQLLDWLAVDFMEHGWSSKRLHKQIVMSATYRQDSSFTQSHLDRDSENFYFARGPRHRLDAEMVRDTMLKASGLLSAKMFGPSVYPPQPASVTAIAYGGGKWPTSQGEDRFRRSLYTFSKRTAPFAASTVFNGPTGEICIARRVRSNTPLQALTLLNDEMFVEYAIAAAKRLDLSESNKELATTLFRDFLTRPPTDKELQFIVDYQQRQLARLNANELEAAKITHEDATNARAAWVLVGRALMNVDEAITKR